MILFSRNRREEKVLAARTDIHFHLMPGLDDGAGSLEESVTMARAAAADGTREIVATPHVRRDFVEDVSDFPERAEEVRALLLREDVDVAVRCGGELGHEMVGTLAQDELETVALGPPGARWLLLETPFEGLDETVCQAADELRERGFGVVLAHPERSAGILEPEARRLLSRELSLGTVPQVNVWSLAGGYGAEAEQAAACLVRERLVGVVASDAHPGWRGPLLSVGAERARTAGLSAREAWRLVESAPARLLERGLTRWTPAAAGGPRSPQP